MNTLFMAGLFINVNYIVVPIFLMLRDGDVSQSNCPPDTVSHHDQWCGLE